jgi:hypothetical protein
MLHEKEGNKYGNNGMFNLAGVMYLSQPNTAGFYVQRHRILSHTPLWSVCVESHEQQIQLRRLGAPELEIVGGQTAAQVGLGSLYVAAVVAVAAARVVAAALLSLVRVVHLRGGG